MGWEKRISFLADGFPIILSSATSYLHAAQQLKECPREAGVLSAYATEEAAKILILMDAVRSPERFSARYLPKICRWFYNHHVRLTYASACTVTGYEVAELQSEFVNFMRKSHRMDGPGAPVVPQWEVWEREATLYADVSCPDDGEPYWHVPLDIATPGDIIPALELVEAMAALGFFARNGLNVTSEIWGAAHFTRDKDANGDKPPPHQELVQSNIQQLIDDGLAEHHATATHVQTIYRYWQIPMYDMDFTPIEVNPTDLKRESYANELWEAGYSLEEVNSILETWDCTET